MNMSVATRSARSYTLRHFVPGWSGLTRDVIPARRAIARLLLGAALLAGPAGVTSADPLNPLDFPSLGAVTLAAGSYTINTGATPPTITGPGMSLAGTVYGNRIAVFSFDAITLPAGAAITITGSRPLALLSAGNMTVATNIGVNGGDGSPGAGAAGGAGGAAIAGDGLGDFGGSVSPGVASRGGMGGGPGGGGGGVYTGGAGSAGGAGGAAYGNILLRLECGSGGGGGGGGAAGGAGGGAGGGAVELGALGTLTLTGSTINAKGGSGGGGGITSSSGGGGSGGAVLLHGGTVTLGVAVNAAGGDALSAVNSSGGGGGGFGGAGGGSGARGGGGGGRIAIQATANPGTAGLSVASGGGNPPGSPGEIIYARPVLTPVNLDCGSVPVGSSITVNMLIQNTGDPNTAINGRFPEAAAPFARVGSGVFSGLKKGAYTACPYTFTPTAPGPFSQTLTFLSNAGPVTVTISGTGDSGCTADLNGDGLVDFLDYLEFLNLYDAGC